jgi:small subunit ribosomal protein S19
MPDLKKRNDQIFSEDTGKKFVIHNGRTYIKVKVKTVMVGHKFGEFVLTRTIRKRQKRTQLRKRK